ncbi:uncharacterized protein SPPG_08054 [Spizellomyces punctatus DAOM BR117]|uniref:Uncharacterized protein n=1 Tax=Spizellomyces punctatus (strain DAOM BR117) TaxID=645134 RepID=A0A0L0H6C7_SPIPD|nr:uncharacterized protein SPPG_08054 [Spizellomyces punctatus DAOM BR117]KNC96461.1 hypothetical protein SPPG_08054 [Spizellomyces punctatus DAOM BR117]|eukprot:XP_016604501.1 hypothetical protein SPPG_08054 [Spizellomyces punctatus DAOM BR117]
MSSIQLPSQQVTTLIQSFIQSPKSTPIAPLLTHPTVPDALITILTPLLQSHLAADQIRAVEAITEVLRHAQDDMFSVLCRLAFQKLAFMDIQDGGSVSLAGYTHWLRIVEDMIISQTPMQGMVCGFLMLNYLARYAAMPDKNPRASKTLAPVELRLVQRIAEGNKTVLLCPMGMIGAHVFAMFCQDARPVGNWGPVDNVQQFFNLFFNVGTLPLPPPSSDPIVVLDEESVREWRETLLSYSISDIEGKVYFTPSCLARDVLFTDLVFTNRTRIQLRYENGQAFFEKTCTSSTEHPIHDHYDWLCTLSRRLVLSDDARDAFAGRLAMYCAILQDAFIPYLYPTCCKPNVITRTGVHRYACDPGNPNIKSRVHDLAMQEFSSVMDTFSQGCGPLVQTLRAYVRATRPHQVWSSCTQTTWKCLGKQFREWKGAPSECPLVVAYNETTAMGTTDGPYAIPWHVYFLNAGIGSLDAQMFVTLCKDEIRALRLLEALQVLCERDKIHVDAAEQMMQLIPKQHSSPFDTDKQDIIHVATTMMTKLLDTHADRFRHLAPYWKPTNTLPTRKRKRGIPDDGSKAPIKGNPFSTSGILSTPPKDPSIRTKLLTTAVQVWTQAVHTMTPESITYYLTPLCSGRYPGKEKYMLDLVLVKFIETHPIHAPTILRLLLSQLKPDTYHRHESPFYALVEGLQTMDDQIRIVILKGFATVIDHWTRFWIDCLNVVSKRVKNSVWEWVMVQVDYQLGIQKGETRMDAVGLVKRTCAAGYSGLLPFLLGNQQGLSKRVLVDGMDEVVLGVFGGKCLKDSLEFLVKVLSADGTVNGEESMKVLERLFQILETKKSGEWFEEYWVEPILESILSSPYTQSTGHLLAFQLLRHHPRLFIPHTPQTGLAKWVTTLDTYNDPEPVLHIWHEAWETCPIEWMESVISVLHLTSGPLKNGLEIMVLDYINTDSRLLTRIIPKMVQDPPVFQTLFCHLVQHHPRQTISCIEAIMTHSEHIMTLLGYAFEDVRSYIVHSEIIMQGLVDLVHTPTVPKTLLSFLTRLYEDSIPDFHWRLWRGTVWSIRLPEWQDFIKRLVRSDHEPLVKEIVFDLLGELESNNPTPTTQESMLRILFSVSNTTPLYDPLFCSFAKRWIKRGEPFLNFISQFHVRLEPEMLSHLFSDISSGRAKVLFRLLTSHQHVQEICRRVERIVLGCVDPGCASEYREVLKLVVGEVGIGFVRRVVEGCDARVYMVLNDLQFWDVT